MSVIGFLNILFPRDLSYIVHEYFDTSRQKMMAQLNGAIENSQKFIWSGLLGTLSRECIFCHDSIWKHLDENGGFGYIPDERYYSNFLSPHIRFLLPSLKFIPTDRCNKSTLKIRMCQKCKTWKTMEEFGIYQNSVKRAFCVDCYKKFFGFPNNR